MSGAQYRRRLKGFLLGTNQRLYICFTELRSLLPSNGSAVHDEFSCIFVFGMVLFFSSAGATVAFCSKA